MRQGTSPPSPDAPAPRRACGTTWRASHDFFDFGFAETAPAVLPVVSVEPCDGLLAPGSQRFRAPDAATLRHAVSKV